MSYSRLSTFENCPQQFDYLYVTKNVQVVESEAMAYGTRVHEALEMYAKSRDEKYLTRETRKWKSLIDRLLEKKGTHLYEYQMAVTPELEPCDWMAKDVWLRGIADVLVVDGDTAYCLDWKTGKVRDNPTQLQLFACMVFLHFPEVKTVKTAFVWLKFDQVTDMVYKRSMFDPMWRNLMQRFDYAQETIDLGVFEAKPSGLCRWCAARDICPYGR
jgi:predicted RecB family nuclease